MKGLLTKVLL